MRYVAVTRVHHQAAASVIKEALVDRGISVQIRRRPSGLLLAAITHEVYDVLVPADRLAEAERALDLLAHESAYALGVSDEPTVEAAQVRRSKRARAILFLALFSPLPIGCVVAGARGLGLFLLLLALVGAIAFVGSHPTWSLGWLLGCKVLDLVGTTLRVTREPSTLGDRDAAHS
jgi:hypothetical protein